MHYRGIVAPDDGVRRRLRWPVAWGEFHLGAAKLKVVALTHQLRRFRGRSRRHSREGGAESLDARHTHFAVDPAIVLEAQAEQQRPQRQPLPPVSPGSISYL